jgi:hypothetical protein
MKAQTLPRRSSLMTMRLVRAAVKGTRDAAMDTTIGPIFEPLGDRRRSREDRPRQGSA